MWDFNNLPLGYLDFPAISGDFYGNFQGDHWGHRWKPGHLHRRRHVAAWHLGGPEASLVLGQTLDLRRTGGEGRDGHT